ncbi:hypothetical protein OROMI_012781 [Orobanche minor]
MQTTTSRNLTRYRSMSKRLVDGKKLPLDIDPANFDVSQISDVGQFRTKTLQSMGRNRRQFKTDLTGEYIYGPSKGLSPCEKYGISEDDLKEFKKTREDPTWKEKRIKKQEIVKQNKAHHTMARGGYDFMVVREMERKLEERKKEASKSGEDVIIDPPSPPSRYQRWKLGRRTRSGRVLSDAAREIVTKIRRMSWRRSVHRAASLPRNDMRYWLRLGRPEHPGRVRGIGLGVGIRDYFGRSSVRADPNAVRAVRPHWAQELRGPEKII